MKNKFYTENSQYLRKLVMFIILDLFDIFEWIYCKELLMKNISFFCSFRELQPLERAQLCFVIYWGMLNSDWFSKIGYEPSYKMNVYFTKRAKQGVVNSWHTQNKKGSKNNMLLGALGFKQIDKVVCEVSNLQNHFSVVFFRVK